MKARHGSEKGTAFPLKCMNKKIYKRYNSIKERCYNPNNERYDRYGGRGIKMCQEWLDNYDLFEQWCLSNGYNENLAIDRKDNDGDYSPDNCHFVTVHENNQNRSSCIYYTIDGVTLNLQQWCNLYGIKRATVNTRLQHGWDVKRALTEPVKLRKRNKTELIGLVFGRLTVLSYAGDDNVGANHNSRWVCQCECGAKTIVDSNKLKSGHTRSCGCLQPEIARRRMLTNNPMSSKVASE